MTRVHTITPLSPADRAEWDLLWQGYLTFYEHALAPAITEETFARLVAADRVHGAIARDAEGRAVGFVHWLTHPSTWSTGDYCYLEDLFVDPDVRGGGVGRALIAHVRSWADDAGCGKLYWMTQIGNVRARHLYDDVAVSTDFVPYEITIRDE